MKTKTRKTLRKSIGIILILALILSAVPLSAFAATTKIRSSDGDWEYEILNSGDIKIVSYRHPEVNGTHIDVVIPDEIDGYTVTWLGSALFADRNDVQTVFLPATIYGFNGDPFDENHHIKEIIVDEDNEIYMSIDGVLYDKQLVSIIRYPAGKSGTIYVIPDGVEGIYEDAFLYCNELEQIIIPDSVETIGAYAFLGCDSLEVLQIPSSVGYIDETAFSSYANITILAEPDSYAANYAAEYGFDVGEPTHDAYIPVTVGTTGIDPNAEVHAGDAAAVVSVNITWEDMEFTYEFGEWNTEDLVYDGEWVNGNAIITVENRSNIAVDVEATFNKADLKGFEDVDGFFSEDYIELDSALDGEEKIGEITFTVDGAPTVAANAVQLGTVTVIITGK